MGLVHSPLQFTAPKTGRHEGTQTRDHSDAGQNGQKHQSEFWEPVTTLSAYSADTKRHSDLQNVPGATSLGPSNKQNPTAPGAELPGRVADSALLQLYTKS